MHWRTEDLLSLRDGEPLDAARRQRIEAATGARGEVQRLSAIRERMRALPQLEAPPTAWRRIEQSLASTRPAPRWRMSRIVGLAAAFAVAVIVVIAALDAGGRLDPPGPADATARQTQIAPATLPSRSLDDDYGTLIAESARLERVLSMAPSRRGVARAGTASTIAGLEEQIARIDALMSESAASETDTAYRHALWRERVMIMDALVDVRFAEASAPIY
jgi:hypothetical protein